LRGHSIAAMQNSPVGPRGRWWLAPTVFALALALLAARSIWHPGYILQVDTVWGPRAAPVVAGFYAPIAWLQSMAVRFSGGDVVGRVYVVAVLFMSAWAPMFLFRRQPFWIQAPVGALGVLNPWTYDRVVEGQWGIAMAAALLFLWLAAFESLLLRPGWRQAAVLAGVGVLIAMFAVHFIGMIFVLTLAGTFMSGLTMRPSRYWWSLGASVVLVVCLLYGAVPFFTGSDAQSIVRVSDFQAADFSFFRSTPDPRYGLGINLLGLQGYWGERLQRFAIADGGFSWWPLGSLVLTGLALTGAFVRRQRAWLLLPAALGLLVSASTALPGGVALAETVSRAVPLLAGYREPQKWSALWLLALVVLNGELLTWLAARGRETRGQLVAAVMGVTLLLPTGMTVLRGVPTTLTPVGYPADWTSAADYMASRGLDDVPVAVLPWHLYVTLGFAGSRTTQNPASVVFPGRLVESADPEIPQRARQNRGLEDIGAAALGGSVGTCNLATAMRAHGIKRVVVEPILEGPKNAEQLLACGFRVDFGSAGRVMVLGD
jgi:hypothetical protein